MIALFEQIQQGSTEAFDSLFLAYYDQLLAFAKQYTKRLESAEEVTSALFVKLWVKRHTLHTVQNPEVYLYVSVKNACLNELRQIKKQQALFVSQEEVQAPAMVHTNAGVEDKELREVLDQAIAALPAQRQLIFTLVKENGLKCKEVAQILDLSVRTVENQLYKAVKSLADTLSIYLGYHPQQRNLQKQVLAKLPFLFFL